jgi:tetratricopeptide (TPR) repeat protein
MIWNGRLTAMCAASLVLVFAAEGQTVSDYDALVQKGKTQLQAGSADMALATGEAAIKMSVDRWEGYALAGGALMNLKRYEEAADRLSQAIARAPEAKQAALRDLRRQCLLAESGASTAPMATTPPATTQAEIVLWKSIENSTNPQDFQSYLNQYPQGAFAALAQRHLAEARETARRLEERQAVEIRGDDLRNAILKGQEGEDNSLLIFLASNGEAKAMVQYRGDRKTVAKVTSDIHSLSEGDFLAKNARCMSTGTWAMDSRNLKITMQAGHLGCSIIRPCDWELIGRRVGDSISGAESFKGKGRCSGREATHVNLSKLNWEELQRQQ